MAALLNWRHRLNQLHRALGDNRLTAWAALKMYHQAQHVLGYSLGDDAHDLKAEQWLLAHCAPQAQTFIDVGANRGDWTAMFLQYSSQPARGLVFEPVPEIASRLSERFKGIEGVTVINAAVADHPGRMEFYVGPGEAKNSSLSQLAPESWHRKEIVSVVTLDDAVAQASISNIDLLKVDAEGYDLNVLRGARRLLTEHRIGVLEFEYSEAWRYASNTLAAALSFLHDLGYATYLLKGQALHTFDYKKFGDYFRYSVFVAAVPETSRSLQQLIQGEI